jgi:hypothetical protein
MLSWYPMENISTQDYEEVTTMEEMSFPCTNDKITISQNAIPGLKEKITSTKHYTIIHTDGIPIIHRKGKIVASLTCFKRFWIDIMSI